MLLIYIMYEMHSANGNTYTQTELTLIAYIEIDSIQIRQTLLIVVLIYLVLPLSFIGYYLLKATSISI